ncbi:MAG: BamA/TamA family outer membrane protein [Actinomycetota bacterium]|nr:BamA/TamA family outer membrane protein [Actinomycetota bacterium]
MTLRFITTLLLVATPLAAQTADEPWRDSFYPIVRYSGNDGMSAGLRFAYNKRGPWEAPYFYAGTFTADLGYSASGSYAASVRLRAPGLKPGWRFDVSASAVRQTRYEFYGVGEATPYFADSVSDSQRYFYRVRRSQLQARAEGSRRITGRFWATAMVQAKETEFSDLPGRSVFTDEFDDTHAESDLITRIGLVYDARNNDYDTHKGALLSVGLLRGTYGEGYDRWVAEARGWLPFGSWRGTWISARAMAAAAHGDVPLDSRLYLPHWEGQARVLGGAESHRGLRDQRLIGRDHLFGNLTVHHDLFNAGGLAAGGLIAFVDAGRVFEESKFDLTTEGMEVGVGGGAYLRLMQTGIYTFNFANGPDGFVFSLGNNWMF